MIQTATHRSRGIFMLSLAAFIWGTAFVAQSVGMEYVGPFTFNAARFLIGGVVLLPLIVWMQMAKAGKTKNIPDEIQAAPSGESPFLIKAGFYCGLVLFISAAFQQIGIIYTTVGKAGFITTLYIVIVPILGLFFGRKVPHIIWICVALAVVGMYLLCINETFTLSKGDFFILVSAFCFSIHILVIDHYSPLVDGVKLSCLQFFVSGTLSGIAAFILENPQISDLLNGWVAVLYAGVISCGIAYTLQILGQRDVPPVIASLLLSLESVFAVLSGWVILGEVLSLKELLGCILIFIAILLAQLPDFFKKRTT